MKSHLNRFANQAAYSIGITDVAFPAVSLIADTGTVVYDMSLSKDLSMFNAFGVQQNSRTTANSYIVKSTGDYLIPLVYGNGIKNGSKQMFKLFIAIKLSGFTEVDDDTQNIKNDENNFTSFHD